MILSDRHIREALKDGEIKVNPLEFNQIQPSSIDLRVGRFFRVFHPGRYPYIDVKEPMEDLTELVEIEEGGRFILHPTEFVIGATIERIELGNAIVGRLDGKSGLGRLGLLIHSTAGFFDPGFCGTATLELSNVSPLPITIYPGMPIGQMSFTRLSSTAQNPYGAVAINSKYQDQEGPTPSRYYEHFKK